MTRAFLLACWVLLATLTSATAFAEEEFFTIQMGTFPDLKGAASLFDRLERQLPAEQRPFLRVERIGGHHAVRLGRCDEAAACEDLLAAIKGTFPGAYVMRAYFRLERIKKMTGEAHRHDQGPASTPPPSPPPPPLFSGSAIVSEPLPEGAPAIEYDAQAAGDGAETADGTAAAPAEDEAAEDGGEEEPAAESAPPSYPRWKASGMLTEDADGAPLQFPIAIFADKKNGDIYVVDDGKGQIILYGLDFFPEQNLGKGRGLEKPKGGAVAPDGRLFVCQAASGAKPPRITILSPAFFVEREILFDRPEAEGFSPNKLAFAPDGTIYVVSSSFPGVARLKPDGSFLDMFSVEDAETTLPETKHGKGVPINDAVFDDEGRLYLLSEYLSRIYVYDAAGSLLFRFGAKGGSSGKLSRPQAITFDSEHRTLVVLDYMRHSIVVFNRQGEYLYEFGGRGWDPGWFQYPVDVESGPAGATMVADLFNRRVQIFTVENPNAAP